MADQTTLYIDTIPSVEQLLSALLEEKFGEFCSIDINVDAGDLECTITPHAAVASEVKAYLLGVL